MSIWGPFKTLTRTSAFFGKELLETIRRPAALFSLVLGPFLIMAVFGAGFSGVRRPLETVLVIPPSSGLERSPKYYQDIVGPAVHIVGVTDWAAVPEQELRAQKLDLVVIAPANAQQKLKAGHQAAIDVLYNVEDPIQSNFNFLLAQQIQHDVNSQIIRQAAAQGEQQAGVSANRIPPETIAEPTVVRTSNLAPTPPQVVPFFGPAVFALILQHLAVTLTALSLVRERLSGAFEIFRVSPAGALEILVGKYAAYAVLNAIVGAIVVTLLVRALGVPFLGSIEPFVAVVALLTFASLGVGMLISIVSDSESQAVQLSLLLLLASVFFSGFVLPVDEFVPGVRALAYALPVTHGIRLIQDLMLRGSTVALWEANVLAAIGAVCFVLTLLLVRRRLRPA